MPDSRAENRPRKPQQTGDSGPIPSHGPATVIGILSPVLAFVCVHPNGDGAIVD